MSSDAFGHLPGAQQLFEAYQKHATAEQQNFTDLLEALEGMANGLHASAQNYRAQEDELETGFGGGA